MRKLRIATAIVAVLALASCAQDIDATDFDQTCVVNTDCQLVFSGNVCDDCGFKNAAISVDAVPEYQAAYDQLRQQCILPNRNSCDGELGPHCDNGKCH